MAEVNTGGGNKHAKGGKAKQKKISLRVDFTPMVDMNMLLITFFMLCTSLSKPQTMEITMPMKDDAVQIKDKPTLSKDLALTLLLGKDSKVYYFSGLPDYANPAALSKTDYSAEGLRKVLLQKNADVVRQIRELKAKKFNHEITEDEFKAQSLEIKKKARLAPYVIIKASDEATYRNLVDALDEMLICDIVQYTITDITKEDADWLHKAEALN